ncbi:MAG TPA: AsmA-like C-terminal region-containing protein [Paucimonas sp.]|nr:AsmA-like C-terminal region-containing protein [Paucimonas sp.]
MDTKTIFTKTAKGLGEAVGKTKTLSRDLRNLLKEIDGKSSVEELAGKLGLPGAKLQESLAKLSEEDYIRAFGTTAAPEDADLELDFTASTGQQDALTVVTMGAFLREMQAQPGDSVAPATQDAEPDVGAAAPQQSLSKEESVRKAVADAYARIEAERLAQKQAVEQAARTAEERKRREAQARAKREAEKKAKLEAEARRIAEQKAKKAAEEQARRAAAEQAKKEAEARARRQKEEAARREAEERARRAAEEQARKEEEEKERLKAAVAKIRHDALEKYKHDLEEQARKEAEEKRRLEAEEQARREDEERMRREAEEQERREAESEARRQAEEQARRLAEEAARREAEERARREAERREAELLALREAEEHARQLAEEVARREAEEEAKRAAEEEASVRAEHAERERQEAEEQARQEEKERARLAAKAQAKLEAEERARHKAEEKVRREARKKAEREARERDREKVRQEAEERIQRDLELAAAREAEALALEAARRDEEEASVAAEELAPITPDWKPERPPRKPVKWGKPVAIALSVAAAMAAVAALTMSYDDKAAQFEKAAAAQFRQPVKVGKVHLALWPQPHWRLENVSIGAQGQIKAARIDALAGLGSWFGGRPSYASVALVSPRITEEGLGWLAFGKLPRGDLRFEEISASDARLASENIDLPAFDIKAEAGKDGNWRKMTLDTPDKQWHIDLQSEGGAVRIEIVADAFAPPFGSAPKLQKFRASGNVTRDGMTLNSFSARLFDGFLDGSAALTWDGGWRLEGNLKARQVDTSKLAPRLLEGGKLEGDAEFAMEAATARQLFAGARASGDIVVNNGALLGVNLASLVRGTIGGGKSAFSAIDAGFLYERGRLQLRNMRLNAGLLAASGHADIDADDNLNGRLMVEVRTPSRHARGYAGVSGTLKAPRYHR